MSQTKKCPKCYLTKSISSFSINKRNKDKVDWFCKDCRSEYNKKRREDNHEKVLKTERDYEKKRLLKVKNGKMPHRRAAMAIRYANNHVIKAMKNNPDSLKEKTFFKNFGCSKKVFIQRFERYFEKNPGMTWQNHGAWHMDHIKPLGSFSLHTEANRKLANHYTNLRPEWATTNMKKSSKYEMEQAI